MVVIAYPQDGPSPQHRVGGFYQTVEEIELAADLLEFDVVVPPRRKQGFYMVPAALVRLEEAEKE